MKWDSVNRRLFLQGAGGFLLSLPLLPSLLARSAFGQSAASTHQYFVGMQFGHGPGNESMPSGPGGRAYDHPELLTQLPSGDPSGAKGFYANLPSLIGNVNTTEGVQQGISKLLCGPLFAAMAPHLTVVDGMTYWSYLAHNYGAILGNPGLNDGNTNGDRGPKLPHFHEFIAQHLQRERNQSAAYPSIHCIGGYQGTRFSNVSTFSNPDHFEPSQRPVLPPTEQRPLYNLHTLINTVFANVTTGGSTSTGYVGSVIDRALADLTSWTTGYRSRFHSAADRNTLDSYTSQLRDVERRYETGNQCERATTSIPNGQLFGGTNQQRLTYAQDFNTAVVLAIQCRLINQVTFNNVYLMLNESEAAASDWHQDIIHASQTAPLATRDQIRGAWLRENRAWLNVYYDLVEKLRQARDANDESLSKSGAAVAYYESSAITHNNHSSNLFLIHSELPRFTRGKIYELRDRLNPAASQLLYTGGDAYAVAAREMRANIPGPFVTSLLYTLLSLYNIPKSYTEIRYNDGRVVSLNDPIFNGGPVSAQLKSYMESNYNGEEPFSFMLNG